jgi:hypothetical protein
VSPILRKNKTTARDYGEESASVRRNSALSRSSQEETNLIMEILGFHAARRVAVLNVTSLNPLNTKRVCFI